MYQYHKLSSVGVGYDMKLTPVYLFVTFETFYCSGQVALHALAIHDTGCYACGLPFLGTDQFA